MPTTQRHIFIKYDSEVVTLLAKTEQMKFQTQVRTLVKPCNFATPIFQGDADEKESEDHATSTGRCCDICDQGVIQMENRASELKLLLDAIKELGNKGEVKIVERIRGGQLTWMKDIHIERNETSHTARVLKD